MAKKNEKPVVNTLMEKRRAFGQKWSEKRPKSVCACGHTGDGGGSRHEDTFQAGHGPCKDPNCECHKFTWVRFTTEFKDALEKVT